MKIYILIEVIERDGIRNFNILHVFQNREKAIKKLKEIVKLDPTGDFKEDGFEIEEETCYRSNYIDDYGFTEYYIEEKKIEDFLYEKKYIRKKLSRFMMYGKEAEIFEDAIKKLANKPDNLDNFISYLSRHFQTWLNLYTDNPTDFVAEIKHFAEMEID